MLDIKFIRENKDLIKEAARKKRVNFDLDKLIEADDKRRALIQGVEKMRAEQNAVTEKISKSEGDEKEKLIVEMRELKQKLQEQEEELKETIKQWQALMLQVPNIPDMSVPEGEDDSQNQEIRTWGERKQFEFEPKNHVDLMTQLDLADFERGTKVAGFRGYFLKNDGMRLAMAVWNYALEHFSGIDGFTLMAAPSLIKREVFLGTGYLPQGEEDLYKTQDGDYLAGTAEVPVMGYFMDEVLEREKLPIKILAFSPCFRREAGSHGKDTKGLMRVHEFFKFEQVVLCAADHQESVKHHESINENTEKFIQSLVIPYRTVVNCGGDLGLGQVKKYDIELWVPSEQRYREISSASYFHDFQTRRLNIRYRDSDGKLRFVHSLNSTAAPTPRLLIALIENNQQADGSIQIPEVLKKYMGKDAICLPQ